jgi:cytochrome c oxidase subunit III
MAEALDYQQPLPVGSARHRAAGWFGMWCLIATEASLFAYLLFAYAYLGARAHGGWVPELPKLRLSLPNTVLLVASSFVLYWGERGIRQGKILRLKFALGATLVMGSVFVAVQLLEWHSKTFRPADNAYASSYFTTTGFHLMHVIGGLLVLAPLLFWSWMGKFGAERHAAVSIGALYWHFVDVVWLVVFFTYYVSPYFMRS